MPAIRTRLPALAVSALLLVACGGDQPAVEDTAPPAAESPTEGGAVTYTAVEYEFRGPASLPAGPVTIELRNEGEEQHELQLVRLEKGRTVEDVEALFEEGVPQGPPPWVTQVGGTFAAPGETAEQPVAADLEAGTYVMLCLVPTERDGEQVPHAALGMIREVSVG
ncbi:MAG TPA: hypothetical protein VNO17_05995 [Actinomycetota bacterium]|nr:hypothetical protein [Actinomycetota bacterium]